MEHLWNEALNRLSHKLSKDSFAAWLQPIRYDGVEGSKLLLRVPNSFYAEWISSHYLDALLAELKPESDASFRQVTGARFSVDESLRDSAPTTTETVTTVSVNTQSSPAPRLNTSAAPTEKPDLNPKYSFDNFVVGPANQLAHAACVAAAAQPGSRFNPLFIYGGVGLGKTHLINAVGHAVALKWPKARICYLSAERFTNEFIAALQHKSIDDFRARYRRNCDVLLMDDIQFLAGREQTQEEFFHTFNALHHADKQIVVTSDVYPQHFSEMQERLISRFQSGMVADIQAPELDTRIAILQSKAEAENIPLNSDVACLLAQAVKTNVRELHGMLIRLAARAALLGRPIDLSLAKETLQSAASTAEVSLTVEDIQRAVCGYFGVRLADLKSKRKHRAVSLPRMLAMYLCRSRLQASFPEIGDRFGGKDHTTVMNACRRIDAMLQANDERIVAALRVLEQKLAS